MKTFKPAHKPYILTQLYRMDEKTYEVGKQHCRRQFNLSLRLSILHTMKTHERVTQS